MLGVVSDIQGQKQAQSLGRGNDTWLKLAQKITQAGAWELDVVSNELQWAPECFSVFGVSHETFQPTYTAWQNLIHPDDRARADWEIRECIQSNKPLNAEYRVIDPAGRLRWINAIGDIVADAQSGLKRVIGLVKDVSAQRQSEKISWQSEQLNQPLLDSLHERAAVLDRDGKIVAVNFAWNAFAQENGDRPDRRTNIGANYLDFYDKYSGADANEAAVIGAGIRGVLSGQVDHFKIEHPCHSAKGLNWFLLKVSPLPRELGGAIITYLDITNRKENEAERIRLLSEAQAAQETAEAATRAKDEFIAQVTHNLRSPLNAILGWSKVLRVQSLDEKTVSDALATIQQSAEKQKYLIEELLEISRMINGNLRLDVSPVSLSAVVRSALETMRQACEAKSLTCDTELAADADLITGDAARLEQAIGNLISNAVKFTPSGGAIKVRLDRISPCVQITVSDTGKGIQAEHLQYLFTRYWRPENSERCRSGGLGLGLSYVRHIAELHGGSVYAESEGENKGAKFILRLPYGNAPSQGQKEVESPKSESRQEEGVNSGKDQIEKEDNITVTPLTLAGLLTVVVDDEQDARELVAAILRQYGAHVLIAASAKEALQLITDSARRPDLLISDISMPEEDGYSLIRKVRALKPDQGGQIPAIALTAYGRMEDRIRVLSAGFQRHVPKPVEPAELALSAAHLTGREIQQLHV